jgi:hypothetical protein
LSIIVVKDFEVENSELCLDRNIFVFINHKKDLINIMVIHFIVIHRLIIPNEKFKLEERNSYLKMVEKENYEK